MLAPSHKPFACAITIALALVLAIAAFSPRSVSAAAVAAPPAGVAARGPIPGYGHLPLSFEPNVGQTDKSVKFLTRSGGSTLYLTGTDAVLAITRRSGAPKRFDPKDPLAMRRPDLNAKTTTSVLHMRMIGANSAAPIAGADKLPGIVNYFIGADPKKWHTSIPTYRKVAYSDVYKGVDLVYYGSGGSLEYDFVVRPGGDPRQIRLAFSGAKSMTLTANGDLLLAIDGGAVTWRKPVVYQTVGGKRTLVAGSYVADGASGVRFAVAKYDAKLPLVIDPVLAYSTYLGGTVAIDRAGIAVDGAGCAYVTGTTYADFPTTSGAFQTTFGGSTDAFVAKLNPDGSSLLYSTFLGGTGNEWGTRVAVDASGCAYVTGNNRYGGFPVTPGALQTGGGSAAFVAKLSPSGSSLVYATYLGGGSGAGAVSIAVDQAGCAFVTGSAGNGFPVTEGPLQTTWGSDSFVAKLNPDGSSLVYATYLGGAYDYTESIALDSGGCAYVSGYELGGCPVTSGAFQIAPGSDEDAFVTKLSPDGSSLVYSTYLGGPGIDGGEGIAVDSSGCAYVIGITSGGGFPVKPGAFQSTSGSDEDAFVTKLSPDGSSLVYSTYLGGPAIYSGDGIAVDSAGCAYVTGYASDGFPVTTGAQQTVFGGGNYDAYLAKLNATGSALLYATYLGGTGDDFGLGIAVDSAGSAYVVGYASSGFPVTPKAPQTEFAGSGYDAFALKLGAVALAPLTPPTVAITSPAASTTAASLAAVAGSISGSRTIAGVSVTIANSANQTWNGSSWTTSCTTIPATVTGGAWTYGAPLPGGSSLPDGMYTITAYGVDSAGAVGNATAKVTVDENPTSTLTFIDANPEFYHEAVYPDPSVDYSKVLSSGQARSGAVCDGLTRVFVVDQVAGPGTVKFQETPAITGSVSADGLMQANVAAPFGPLPYTLTAQVVQVGQSYYAFAIYQSPRDIRDEDLNEKLTFSAAYSPAGSGVASQSSKVLTIVRPPILLVHGLWSSAYETWDNDTGVKALLDEQGFTTYEVDYHDHNLASVSLAQNRDTVMLRGVIPIRESYQASRIAITQVDVVGHSMGGLITREMLATSDLNADYKFYGRGCVRRLITLGTPHFGSPWINMLVSLRDVPLGALTFGAYCSSAGHPIGNGAIDDMVVDSQALQGLPHGNYQAFSIAGDATSYNGPLAGLSFAFNAIRAYDIVCSYLTSTTSSFDSSIFISDTNDVFVPVSSAIGGESQTHSAVEHGVAHIPLFSEPGLCTSSAVAADVLQLELSASSVFATGFGSEQAGNNVETKRLNSLRFRLARPLFQAATPFIGVTAPVDGAIVPCGSTLNFSFAATAETSLNSVLVVAGTAGQVIADSETAPFSISISLPPPYAGILPITVYATDTNGNTCSESLTLFAQPTANLTSLTATPAVTTLTSIGSSVPLAVTGGYSDSVSRDVTSPSLGTSYATSDPSVALPDLTGAVTAEGAGSAIITISNGATSTQVMVNVAPAVPELLSVTPSSGAAGTTVAGVKLIGSDFGAASNVAFYRNGALNSTVTAANVTLDSDGSIQFDAVIGSGSPAGPLAVVVTTPGGASSTTAVAENTFTVTAAWTAGASGQSIAVGGDDKTRVLWTRADGAMSPWLLSSSNALISSPVDGPFAGWTAFGIATGSDNYSHVLWSYATPGVYGMWLLDPGMNYLDTRQYGPYSGWTLIGASSGGDGKCRLLWTNTSGQISVWLTTQHGDLILSPVFGPYAGWTAVGIATEPGNTTRLLWTNTNGQAAVWNLNPSLSSETSQVYGPYSGWAAFAVAAAQDGSGSSRVLWRTAAGQMSEWMIDSGLNFLGSDNYGPYAGWTPVSVTCGPDGTSRVLWSNTSGQASVWRIDSTASLTHIDNAEFGPY